MAKSVVQPINHLNYPNKDGQIYCRMSNAIKKIGDIDCFGCPLLSGSMLGAGVECTYTDMVTDNINVMALTIPDPMAQLE